MSKFATKAVILARGLGTRMRAETPGSGLDPEQERIADTGAKALMPISNGRTLLEYILKNLSDAGFTDTCLVVGPEHYVIREFCTKKKLDVSFAVQAEPRGTADAVLAASRNVSADRLYLVVNSDNLYPVQSLKHLREADRPAMLAFERNSLIENSNLDQERIGKFATVRIESGFLKRIVEKPGSVSDDSYISMNAWLFSHDIFDACRAIGPSERGEYEITAAVQYAIDELGIDFTAVRSSEGVLDLSSRVDVATVGRFLDDLDRRS
ncbi:MAG: nucleotidyltransferase family protein [Pyrinomonadaceae bacterium]